MKIDREQWWNDTDGGGGGGKSKYCKKIMVIPPLFTTNLTWADLGTNPGLLGEVEDYSPEPWHYFES
jgi:hypothetical protein